MFARFALLSAFCLVVAGTGFVHARIPPATHADRGEAFVPEPEVAKALAMGFDAVLADYYWLQAVQAIGGDAQIDAELGRHLGKLIDVVTTLNPWVDHPYRFAGVWLTESEDNVRTANRLLRRSLEYHPNEWRNRFYLGFNHFYYLLENEEAADVLEEASRIEGSPRYLPRLVARLRASVADIDVAELFLRQMIQGAEDGQTKAEYQAGLDEIEIERKARFLDQAREAFRRQNGRDITSVEELVEAEHPMLGQLPNPEPESLPATLTRDSVWKIDPETDQIYSTYIGGRYQLHMSAREHARAKRWKERREARKAERSGEAAQDEDGDRSDAS